MLDGSAAASRRLRSMLHWDVNNGIARRAWARNPAALATAQRAMEQEPLLHITIPFMADDTLLQAAWEAAQ